MENNSMQSYLNHTITCSCGKEHSCNIKEVEVGSGALRRLPEWIVKYGFSTPLFVYDETTYRLAGAKVEELIKGAGIAGKTYILPYAEPVADTHTCELVKGAIDRLTDLVVAVGSGTINDVCRYVSHQQEIPYFIVGTAPSMDGYASNVSPLIVNNLKITYEAQVPMAIIGDSEFLKDAPMSMIAAGVGDILGKYTCLMDWKIAHMVVGEYHCEMLAELVRKAIEAVVSSVDGLVNREESAIMGVMEGLILSGIAMSFAGNSRPASGSEHHLSHYWEMMFLFEKKPPVFHGTKVGIATILVLRLYERLLADEIDFDAGIEKARSFDFAVWETYMRQAYAEASGAVIELEKKVRKNAPENVIKRLNYMRDHWQEIRAMIQTLPKPEAVEEMLLKLGAPTKPSDVSIEDKHVTNAIKTAKELRDRFGLLQMLFDLGMAEELA